MNSDGLDILKLYSEWDAPRWNRWLTERLAIADVAGLSDTRRRLQIGMDNLAKQKLNTPKVQEVFFRMQRSIEKTLEKIHERQNPNPLYLVSDKALHKDHIKDKRNKREAFERFLKKTSY